MVSELVESEFQQSLILEFDQVHSLSNNCASVIIGPRLIIKEDTELVCFFCARVKRFHEDEMEQVVCDPVKNEISICRDFTNAMRCGSCKLKGRVMTFDKRTITDPSKILIVDDGPMTQAKRSQPGIPIEKTR